MAAQTPAGDAISATAKVEGGPEKGSTSAQMQSEVGKTRVCVPIRSGDKLHTDLVNRTLSKQRRRLARRCRVSPGR